MANITIETIYIKQNDQISEYLEVVFQTDQGFYQVGYGQFDKVNDVNLFNFKQCDFLDGLKSKYGILEIVDLRVSYDIDMYFLVSDKFLLILGYRLSSETEHSINEFWIEEDIYTSNNNALKEFYRMEKVMLPV